MPTKKKAPKAPEVEFEGKHRVFVTVRYDIKNGQGVTMFNKDQRVSVITDLGRYGVVVHHPLNLKGDLQPTWRLFNHELKGDWNVPAAVS